MSEKVKYTRRNYKIINIKFKWSLSNMIATVDPSTTRNPFNVSSVKRCTILSAIVWIILIQNQKSHLFYGEGTSQYEMFGL